MATRDNQTLQIIIISLCFLLVLTAVAAVFGWRYKGDAETALAEAKNSQSDIEESHRQQFEELKTLRKYLGFKEEENLQTIREAYDQDMQELGETFTGENKNYRTIAKHVKAESEQLSMREQAARKELSELNTKFLALKEEKDNSIAEFQQKSDAEVQHAAKEREEFNRFREQLQAQLDDLVASLAQKDDELQAQLAIKDEEIGRLTQEVQNKTQIAEDLKAGRQQDHTVFERADGRITWVNQATGKVWINLGYADSLREQISFSVYDEHHPVAGENEPKAKIEVTRVVDDHLSEARILQDESLNPIVPGDQIYSPVWEKGKKVRFALTGFIDFDGDGRDDTQRARLFITSNGGIVDAYINAQGETVGEMTVNTRFLVVGEEPTKGLDAELLGKQSASRQQMLRDANSKGVDEISVDKFLSFVGWRPEEKVVMLGTGARAEDFPPEPHAGGSGTTSGSTFRRRYPGTPY